MQHRVAWRGDPPLADHVGAVCMTLSWHEETSSQELGRLDTPTRKEGGMYV